VHTNAMATVSLGANFNMFAKACLLSKWGIRAENSSVTGAAMGFHNSIPRISMWTTKASQRGMGSTQQNPVANDNHGIQLLMNIITKLPGCMRLIPLGTHPLTRSPWKLQWHGGYMQLLGVGGGERAWRYHSEIILLFIVLKML